MTQICLLPEQIKKLKDAIQKTGGAETFLKMTKDARGKFLLDIVGNKQIADLVNVRMELALDTGKRQVIANAFKQMFSPEIRKIKESISKERQALLDEKRTLERELSVPDKEITPTEKKEKKEKLDILRDKIENTTDVKIVDRILKDYNEGKSDFISGAFEKAFNTQLTNTELDRLYTLSNELKELKKKGSDNIFGRPNIEYYQKLEEIKKFFDAQKTIETFKTLTGTIPVGSLLLSPKSAFLNNFSNALSSGIETIISRGTKLQTKISNYDLVLDYIKYSQDVYLASGINVSRVTNSKEIADGLEYLLPYGSLETMQANTKLQAMIKKWGTFYEKTIFSGRINKENRSSKASIARMASLGYSDTSFSAFNFADEVVSIANQIAKKEGATNIDKRSREIAIDIFQAATETVDYRLMSVEDIEYHGMLLDALQRARYRAEVAIFQDTNLVNEAILGIRDTLNKVIPDLSIGSTVSLFVKTPVNVWILKSYRYFGMEAVQYTIKAVHEMYSVKQISPDTLNRLQNSYVRTGTSWVLGLILVALIQGLQGDDDDDPLYSVSYNTATPELRKIYTQKNIPYNAFRIGKYWFSADYFGGTASVVLSVLDSTYNNDKDISKLARTGMFLGNAFAGWESLPIISEIYAAANYKQQSKMYDYSAEKIVQDTFAYFADIASRPIKIGVLTDITKIIDQQKRQVDYTSGWSVPMEQIAINMPVVSMLLAERYSFTGQKLNQPAAINQILFGARYGSEKDSIVVDELYRLTRENFNLNLGIENKKLYGYGVKKTLEELDIPFKERNRVEAAINKNIFNAYSSVIIDDADEYKDLNDEAKAKKLNALVTDAVESGLEETQWLQNYKDYTETKKRLEKEAKENAQ